MATREDVLKVASLARIRLSEGDLVKIQQRLSAILDYFQILNEAKTEGVAPLFHGLEQLHLRPDEPEAPLNRDELLQNAPESFENCFRLPKVVGAVE